MTLRTITFDDSTHKLVPLEAEEFQIQEGCLSRSPNIYSSYQDWWSSNTSSYVDDSRYLMAKFYRAMITAAPVNDYEQPEYSQELAEMGFEVYLNIGQGLSNKELEALRQYFIKRTYYDTKTN